MGKTISKALNSSRSKRPRGGCVSLTEAAKIVRPAVSRTAVFRWIRSGKLKAYRERGEGPYLITMTHLRAFARRHGRG